MSENSVFSTVSWDSIKTDGEVSLLPPGEYNLIVVSAQEKETKSGGKLLRVCFHVKDGEQKDKAVFENFNVVNSNEQAQNIALSAIKSIFTANGVDKISDESELVGMSCRAKITVETSDQYGSQNRIRIVRLKKVTTSNVDIF